MTPKRIQLSRKRGWKLPPNTVVVSRPSKWGNPWRVGVGSIVHRDGAVLEFERGLAREHNGRPANGLPSIAQIKTELRGKNLACWCPLDQPCHADVLLQIANTP